MSYLVSSDDDDDLLNFTTPSSEGLETLSSEDDDASSSNGSHVIKPLGLGAYGPISSIPKPSPRSHSPDKSFSRNGGTAVTSNILSVLSSYRKGPGGRGGGRGGGGGVGAMSGTLSPRGNTNEYDDDQSLEGSLEHSSSMLVPTSSKVIYGYMGESSQLVPQHSVEYDEPRSPIDNSLFMRHRGNPNQLLPHHARSVSPTDHRIKSEGYSSSDSREDSRDAPKSAPTCSNNARFRRVATTVKQSLSSVEATKDISSAMSVQQQRQIDAHVRKQQKEEDARKAKLLQFLGGASKEKGVVGD